jgi:predicted ribosome quality control (RQC) complex YloA/Tae2 family protein
MADAHHWSPTLAVDDSGAPLEYAPYALTHLEHTAGAQLQAFDSISDAMERFFVAQQAAAGLVRRGDALAAERKALLAPLERAARTTERRIAALEHQLATSQAERDVLRRAGEAILAHQSELSPGADELIADGERVALDPRLSAVENAQAYFGRYRKAREAEERVPGLLAEARQSVEYLAELRALVEVADQMDAIRALRREVAAATGATARAEPRHQRSATPYRRVAVGDGWEALVGTSAAGNATVTFDLARPDDVWLHARGVPGAHVILRGDGAQPPASVLERAAELAAAHSAARAAGAVEVDVTPRRYVKKIPGAAPGLVRYANERTLRVTPRAS